MRNIIINMENKFKEEVDYLIEYKNIISNKDCGYHIKIGTPLIIFYIKRLDKDYKKETVRVMKSYVEEIGLENYIHNQIDIWSFNYEDELEKIRWNENKMINIKIYYCDDKELINPIQNIIFENINEFKQYKDNIILKFEGYKYSLTYEKIEEEGIIDDGLGSSLK